MKRFLNIFVFLFVYTDASATVFGPGNHSVGSFSGDDNIINSGAVINADGGTISVTGGMKIYNDGIINGNLDTNDFNVHIRNGGTINGNIILYRDDALTQIVQSDSDIQILPITGDYDFIVNVENFDWCANLNSLQNLGAGTYFIKNSEIKVDDFSDWQNWGANVTLSNEGVCTLVVTDSSTVTSGTIISHVTNASNIMVRLDDLDGLYTVDFTGQTQVVMNVVRETNYEHIFNGNLGSFLESLKTSDSDFMNLLNNANTMANLRDAMNLSYRFNPSVLMRPVKAVHNFSLMNNLFNDKDSGIGLEPFYIAADNANSFGARLYLNTKYDDIALEFGATFNKFDYDNQFNDFGGFIYGGDVNIRKNFNNFWLHGLAGLSMIQFKTESMYVDGNIKSNPFGHYFYSAIDAGYDYKIFDDLVISPLMGLAFQKYGVVNFSDTDTNFRAGFNTRYSFVMDGFRYEYLLLAGVNTNSDLFGSIQIGFASVADGAGAKFDLDVFKTDVGTDYRASIDARVMF